MAFSVSQYEPTHGAYNELREACEEETTCLLIFYSLVVSHGSYVGFTRIFVYLFAFVASIIWINQIEWQNIEGLITTKEKGNINSKIEYAS